MVTGNIPILTNVSGKSTQTVPAQKTVSQSSDADFKSVMDQSVSKNISDSQKKTEKIQSESTTATAMDRESAAEKILKADEQGVTLEELNELEKEIITAVKDILGITDEELESLLAESGFVLADLLIPQNTAAFVADALADGDSLKLLTDSSISQTFSELTETLTTIMADAAQEMSMDPEVIAAALYEAERRMAEEGENYQNIIAEEPVVARHENSVETAFQEEKAGIVEPDLEEPVRTMESRTDNESALLEEKITITVENQQNTGNEGNKEQGNQNNGEISNQFVQTLISSVEEQLTAENTFDGQVQAEEVVRQLVDEIKVHINENVTSMEFQLNPENLGKVNLTVEARHGIITAQLTAQNEAVKAALESQLTVLRENMNAQGLKVEAVEVTIASHSFENGRNFEGSHENNQEQKESSRKIRNLDLSSFLEDDLSEEESLAAEMMQANGNSIDYSA